MYRFSYLYHFKQQCNERIVYFVVKVKGFYVCLMLQNETTISEVNEFVLRKQWKELTSVLCHGRLAFGTAGLRGPMKAGYVCMNDLMVLQTAQVNRIY